MDKAPEFDIEAAHRYFSAHCFNRAWDLIEKKERTPEDDRLMVALNQASLYHWSQRGDSDDRRRSVGYWQASRIQALLGNYVEAGRYGEVCLSFSRNLEPFYLGYAYEALARAALGAGETTKGNDFLARAREEARAVGRPEDRKLLEDDLAALS